MNKYLLMATENQRSGNLDAAFVRTDNIEFGNVILDTTGSQPSNVVKIDKETVDEYLYLFVDIAQSGYITGTYQNTIVVPVISSIYEDINQGAIIETGSFTHFTVKDGRVELTKIDICLLYDSAEGTLTVGKFGDTPEEPLILVDDIYISRVTGIK